MIESADEFVRLRYSEVKEEYDRAALEEAPLEVWWEVVRRHPEQKGWVVHNRTVPLEILEALVTDSNAAVRRAVAMKRKLTPDLFDRLARDADDGVRHAIVHNAKAPEHVLRELLDDSWTVIADAAKARLAAR